jgi:hypothetical protein
VLRGTSPAATGAALRWPQFRAQLPPRARWARRAGLPMWRICRSFVEANAGTRTPDPLLTMEKRGTCSHGAQCPLSSGIGLDYASDGRAADPARCGRIPAVSAPNGRLGVSLASGAMCRLRGAPLPSRGRRTLGTPDETAALMGKGHSGAVRVRGAPRGGGHVAGELRAAVGQALPPGGADGAAHPRHRPGGLDGRPTPVEDRPTRRKELIWPGST